MSKSYEQKKNLNPHQLFQQFVKNKLYEYYIQINSYLSLVLNAHLIVKVLLLDLTKAEPILRNCYSTPRGIKPRNPVCMLRSLIVMTLSGTNSITQWVDKMRSYPLFAILSGFESNDTPGVGTFYEFIERLWKDTPNKSHKKKLRIFKRKPRKKYKKGEKQPLKHPGITRKLVNRIIHDEQIPLSQRPQDTWNTLFKECFVLPSADLGILGNPKKLSVSGDGTPLETGASHFGHKVCNCKSKGIYDCTCPRYFSDPDASWGWDSYREKYVYGRTLYELVAADSPYDLPVYFKLAQCQRHDSVLTITALNEFRKFYPELSISEFLGDSANDSYPIYELLFHWIIEPFIALNEKNKGHFTYDPQPKINENGIPICKNKTEMTFWGFCPDRHRLKWRCPLICGKISKCKFFNCSKSDYGRVIYTKPKTDFRLFTPTPRDSSKWKKKYSKRTSSERSNKRKKIDYNLEHCRVRSTKHWFTRTMLIIMCQHVDAWLIHSKINPVQIINKWTNHSSKNILLTPISVVT